MGRFYDDKIEFAIQNIWGYPSKGKEQEALQYLKEEASKGDADACYFLGRCYLGESFVPGKLKFKEDSRLAREYFNRSIEGGSAIGMFAARRLGGFEPRLGSYIHTPYHSDKEVWDAVYRMAEEGEPFAQHVVATAYYYLDVTDFFDVDYWSLSEEKRNELGHECYTEAIRWYKASIANGIGMGIGNLYTILSAGKYDIPVDEKTLQELKAMGMECNDGFIELVMAGELEGDAPDEALKMYQKALSHGEERAYYYMGRMYTYGGAMPLDFVEAWDLFDKGIKSESMVAECHEQLGKIFYYGGDGMAVNYKRAVKHFSASCGECEWSAVMLGTCYLKGQGVKCDYTRARKLFETYPDNIMSAIGLGEIYAYGLDAIVDIPKAMKYWDLYPEDEDIIENHKNFQKTVSGWKQIKPHPEYDCRGIKKYLTGKNIEKIILLTIAVFLLIVGVYIIRRASILYP